MKIIEALKKIKDLKLKASDLCIKAKNHCSDMDYESSLYPDQRKEVDGWIQGHHDILKEIGHLKFRIQKTNIQTQVTIELGEKHVTKSIAEWIYRRKELAALEATMWAQLGDRNLKDANLQLSQGQIIPAKVRRYYDPQTRDKMLSQLKSEPSVIDGQLEIVNAVTDLVE